MWFVYKPIIYAVKKDALIKNNIMIEIGLCADENFAMPCGVCITSIFETNRDESIRIHILTDGFSPESELRFKKTAQKYSKEIKIYKIDSSVLQDMPINNELSLMTYARLLFSKVLDISIEKLLYLDCDIIAAGEIKDLWNTDISKYFCGAVPDPHADDIRLQNRTRCYGTYFNAGVLLMNLSKWRKEDVGEKCIKYIMDYPERCQYEDQDAINAVLGKDIGLLHFKYNFTIAYLFNERYQLLMHKDRFAALDEAQKNPIIIHYTAPIKPWHKELKHPIICYFLDAKNKSFWADYKIKYKYNSPRQRVIWFIRHNKQLKQLIKRLIRV